MEDKRDEGTLPIKPIPRSMKALTPQFRAGFEPTGLPLPTIYIVGGAVEECMRTCRADKPIRLSDISF